MFSGWYWVVEYCNIAFSFLGTKTVGDNAGMQVVIGAVEREFLYPVSVLDGVDDTWKERMHVRVRDACIADGRSLIYRLQF